jgi:hypothetical protein
LEIVYPILRKTTAANNGKMTIVFSHWYRMPSKIASPAEDCQARLSKAKPGTRSRFPILYG